MIYTGAIRGNRVIDPELRHRYPQGFVYAHHSRNAITGIAYYDIASGQPMFFPDPSTYPKGGYLPGEDVPDGRKAVSEERSQPGQSGIVPGEKGSHDGDGSARGSVELGIRAGTQERSQVEPSGEASEIGAGVQGYASLEVGPSGTTQGGAPEQTPEIMPDAAINAVPALLITHVDADGTEGSSAQ